MDSFKEEEIPNFDNDKFFETIHRKGLGEQSLVKYSISPQNLSLEFREEIVPIQVGMFRGRKIFGRLRWSGTSWS